MRYPLLRLAAWAIDWLTILAWVGVMAAVGVPLYLAGLTVNLDPLGLNVMAALVVVVPTTLGLAFQESGSAQATLGKRVLRLRVVKTPTARRIGLARAFCRNALKMGLPWLIGHAAVYALVADDTNPGAITLTALAYVLPIIYIVMLFVGRGHVVYDRICGTRVVRLPPSGEPRAATLHAAQQTP